MTDDVLALLAMRHGVGESRALLAQQLWRGAAVRELQDNPRWAPSRASWAVAKRQRDALLALGLRALPPSQLPLWVGRVKPQPILLFVRGRADLLWRRGIAIVGARKASASAFAWAWRLGHTMAAAGELVVSGGAQGCDAAAHLGALAAGGLTCAYLGVPIDRIYPMQHSTLFGRILDAGGALISEHPPGAPTRDWAHAARNRFIAAQARTLYIAEADQRSGTLGTARYARKYGVPIRVAPESVGELRKGIQSLLNEGWAEVACEVGAADYNSGVVARERPGV